MKKTLTILFSFLVSLIYAQTYTRSDSVNSIAMNYLNMYRAYYKLSGVKTNMTFKDSCVAWSTRTAEPISTKNGKKDSKWIIRHTKSRVAEVITGTPINIENLSDTTKFAKFVKVITKKNLSKLSEVDMVIMESLYSWENSASHKEILTDPSYTKAYFEVYYKIIKVDKNDVWYAFFSIIELK